MAANVSERVYKISVDGASAIKQLEKISDSASSIDKRMQQVGSALKAVFAVGAIVAGAKAVSDEVLRVAERFDEMGKAAQKVGVAAETLSALKFAAEQSGVGFDQLQVGLKKMSVGLLELEDATSKSGSMLKALGVTTKDTAETAFTKVAQKLSEMPDGFQKTAAAMAIFGKSGADLIPLLNEGADGVKKMTDRAAELGLVMKDSTIAQLTLFNDSLDEIRKTSEGLRNKLIEGLAPALAGIAKTIADASSVSDAWVAVGKKLGEIFVAVSLDINTVITDIQIMALAVRSLASLDALKAFGTERQKLIDQNDKFRTTLLENVAAADQMTGATIRTGDAAAVTAGKFEAGALEKWAESLKKSAEEMDLIPEKMNILAQAMTTLKERGEEGSNAFKVMSDAYKKLNEDMAKGNVGATIELQVQKLKDEAALAAEKFEYLSSAIAVAFEQGDTEGAQLMIKMMQDLQGETDKTQTQFEQLSEGIENAIAQNASNAVNSFIDNIGQAQMSFTDFAASVIKDIAKMVVQLLIMKPLMDSIKGFMGFGTVGANAQGNAYSSGTSLAQGIYTQPTLFKFAKGGTFGRSTGLMGEAGPEAIVPLKRTASGDLGVQASPVNVNVYNNAGVDVETRTSDNADGSRQIDILIERKVRDGIANGSFDRAMRGSYGLARVGA
jgi:lambda family phage tail tape measure protein